MRTVEFQRAIQGATADLVKVSVSKNMDEYKLYRSEAEKSLSEVKTHRMHLNPCMANQRWRLIMN